MCDPTGPVAATEFPVAQEYSTKRSGITAEDIRKLRAWLATQPHLPEQHITDLDLVLCFHCCERSAEVAKQVLDLNFTLKSMFHIFKGRVVDDNLLKIADYTLAMPLAGRTPEGYAVYYVRLIDYDVKKFVFLDAARLVFMMLDLWQYATGTWPGLHVVIDMDGVQLAHITKLDISTIQQFLYFLQEAALMKLKGFHFCSAPSFIDRLLLLMRPFMKRALMDMLHIHSVGSDSLQRWVPTEIMPKDCGGSDKSFEQARDDVKARLVASASFFERERHKRVVESKRPGTPKTISDIFGSVEGSFKKLDID